MVVVDNQLLEVVEHVDVMRDHAWKIISVQIQDPKVGKVKNSFLYGSRYAILRHWQLDQWAEAIDVSRKWPRERIHTCPEYFKLGASSLTNRNLTAEMVVGKIKGFEQRRNGANGWRDLACEAIVAGIDTDQFWSQKIWRGLNHSVKLIAWYIYSLNGGRKMTIVTC